MRPNARWSVVAGIPCQRCDGPRVRAAAVGAGRHPRRIPDHRADGNRDQLRDPQPRPRSSTSTTGPDGGGGHVLGRWPQSTGKPTFASDRLNRDGPFSSSFWGIQMMCGWSQCSSPGQINLNAITLTATENQAPSLTALGANNLWYQTRPVDLERPRRPLADDGCSHRHFRRVQHRGLCRPSLSQVRRRPEHVTVASVPDPTWTPTGAQHRHARLRHRRRHAPLTIAASNAAGFPTPLGDAESRQRRSVSR